MDDMEDLKKMITDIVTSKPGSPVNNENLFNDMVEQDVKHLKENSYLPHTVLTVVKNNNIFNLPIMVMGVEKSPLDISASIIKLLSPEFYIVMAMAWGAAFKDHSKIPEYERGDIAKLPAQERIEVLTFTGRSMDGKFYKQQIFEIKRQIHGDDESKVIDVVDMKMDKSKTNYLP